MENIRHKNKNITRHSTTCTTYNTRLVRVAALPGAWLSTERTCVNLRLESRWPATGIDVGLNGVDVRLLWDGAAVYEGVGKRWPNKLEY